MAVKARPHAFSTSCNLPNYVAAPPSRAQSVRKTKRTAEGLMSTRAIRPAFRQQLQIACERASESLHAICSAAAGERNRCGIVDAEGGGGQGRRSRGEKKPRERRTTLRRGDGGGEVRGEMGERPHVRYSAVSNQDDFQDRYLLRGSNWGGEALEEDLRYRFELHDEVPWGSIVLGLFLLAMGCVLLAVSHFIFTEHMGGDLSRASRIFALGILLVLPGYYATRIAYYSWRGYKGFKFSGMRAY